MNEPLNTPKSMLPSSLVRRDASSLVPESDLMPTLVKPQLTESRRVAIGRKDEKVRQSQGGGGTWRAPVKLDYFLVTMLEQDEKGDFLVDRKFHEKYGDKPRQIQIKLIFDRIALNAGIYLGLYSGRQAWCKGNGQVALRVQEGKTERKQVDCPCEHLQTGKCKRHMVFQFQLPGMGIGEVAKFRSTGIYTIKSILGGLYHLKETVAMILGCSFDEAPIAGVPLIMKYQKRTVNAKDGKSHTIPMVSVAYEGTEEELADIVKGRQDFYRNTKRYVQQLDMERKNVQELLLPEPAKVASEIQQEFHPEEHEPPKETPKKLVAQPDDFKKIESGARKALAHSELPPGMQDALEPQGTDALTDDTLIHDESPLEEGEETQQEQAPPPAAAKDKKKEKKSGDWL